MYINKSSVTKIEAADRVNLLHGTSCSFEQYKSSKPGQILISLRHFMIVTKDSSVKTKKLNIT